LWQIQREPWLMDPMRVLVADDHPLYREAVRLRIERLLPRAEVVEAGGLDDVLAAMAPAAGRFDLILLDLHIADIEPEASARAVIEAAKGTPVLLMSGSASTQTIKRAIGYGARGFLPKTMGSDLFAAAISMVLNGGSYLPVEILQESAAVSVAERPADERNLDDMLTTRERQVLIRLATGASNKEIGRDLSLAEVTVKLHVRQILRKIGARNRSEAAAIATRAALM
jgi:two-component system, NarL family, nitrate/nitrite response regulator NarL